MLEGWGTVLGKGEVTTHGVDGVRIDGSGHPGTAVC